MSNRAAATSSDTAIVIPARYNSSRLPGKPLAMISGKTMLERVWRNACAALANKELVLIATDDDRIREAAEQLGASVVMTPADCENGSERAFAASKHLPASVRCIVNLQGDSPLVPPRLIQALISIRRDSSADIATLAVPLEQAERQRIRTEMRWGAGTYVVYDQHKRALYFSRYPIPFVRESGEDAPLNKHVGIYAYTRESLRRYLDLPRSGLEQSEKLEQLRALEGGMSIVVQECSLEGRTLVSVDTPADLNRAEEVIAREGELLP